MGDRNYGGIIWTNHALQRLKERGVKQGDAWAVWNRPDQSRYSASKGAWIYYKTWGEERIEVVAKKNENREWIILSVWSKKAQPLKIEPYKSGSFWLKLLRKIFNND